MNPAREPDRPDPGPFPDDALRWLLRRLLRFGFLLESHDHGGVRASASEVMALGELSGGAALTQQELGQRLGLEKSTVSRLVSGMEQRHWVTRERDPANRRFARLSLSNEGRRAADHIGQHFRQIHASLFGALTPEERAALTVGLTGLLRVVEQHAAQHHPH